MPLVSEFDSVLRLRTDDDPSRHKLSGDSLDSLFIAPFCPARRSNAVARGHHRTQYRAVLGAVKVSSLRSDAALRRFGPDGACAQLGLSSYVMGRGNGPPETPPDSMLDSVRRSGKC
jgi:hypothetical protein